MSGNTDNELLISKLKQFFNNKSDQYSFIISTDKLSNISPTVIKMIVNIYFKTGSKFIDFKQKLSIMRQPGVSNVKYDMFIELLFKCLENEEKKLNEYSNSNNNNNGNDNNISSIKNKKKSFLQLVKNDNNNNNSNSENTLTQELNELNKNIIDIENKLKKISSELNNSSIDSKSLQLQPILNKNDDLYLLSNDEDSLEDKKGRNYINGIQVCLDPEMDLLKVSIQNKSMANFYKQKLNITTTSSKSTETLAFDPSSDSKKLNKTKFELKELPIHKHKEDILQLVNENHLSIITSQTGSGKSTQLPQFFLNSTSTCKIIMTQPRRLAATTLSRRIAEETGTQLGDLVGYKIRFESMVSENTKLTVATEGVLLTELTSLIKEKKNCEYTHIIIDEAHERSLNLDVILSLIKLGIKMKLFKGTKIVITSAALNVGEFTSFFINSPVLDIEGSKNHPVMEIFSKRPVFDQFKESLNIVKRIHENEKINESILIFMPGLEEIEVMASLLSSHLPTDIKIIKLHSMKESGKDTDDLFTDFNDCRKIIISTNIAETSVTLPSVSFMINSGLYKLKTEYKNISKLTTVPITQMMHLQRVGRLGRVSKGTVYHLFTKTDYDSLIKNNISEIEITNLKIVMLIKNYINCNLQLIKEPLRQHQLKAQLDLIKDGALKYSKKLTDMGQFIMRMPLSYNHSRLLYICIENDCKRLGIILVSFLSQRTPFIKQNKSISSSSSSSSNKNGKKYENMFIDSSDHLSLVNISIQFNLQPVYKRESWCKENDLDYKIMQQGNKIQEQLETILENRERKRVYNENTDTIKEGESERLLKSININLSRSNVAKKMNLTEYQILSNGLIVKIHPTSAFMGKIGDLPEYICFEEVLVLNDINYVINVSEFDCGIIARNDVCRDDYRVVRKVGSDSNNNSDQKLISLIKEWQLLRTDLMKVYKRQEELGKSSIKGKDKERGEIEQGKKTITGIANGPLVQASSTSNEFNLKKKKKRKLNL
ncbi:hypothetical protein ACO0SA_003868 [Hanseniaspora valbyensis]